MLRRPGRTHPFRPSATKATPRTRSPGRRRQCGNCRLVVLGAAASLLSACAVAGSLWYWTKEYPQPRQLREVLSPLMNHPVGAGFAALDTTTTKYHKDRRKENHNSSSSSSPADLEWMVERLSRAYTPVRTALPCRKAEPRWFGTETQQTPSRDGLLFVKPFKTAGSTAVGVHLRIAIHLAKGRRGIGSTSHAHNEICKVRFDHSIASRMQYGKRYRGGTNSSSSSFLWSIVRDPSSRAVSHYHHFVVGRHNVAANDETFQYALRHPNLAAPNSYYLRVLTLEDGGYDRLSRHPPDNMEDAIAVIQGIVDGYDFLAVTERFDESMVALQLLTGTSLSSVLYLSAKRGGGYDDGGGKKTCVQLPPHTNLTPAMTAFLESPKWTRKIQFDQLLHRVANRSLDRTIDETIGRAVFERQLGRYLEAQRLANEKCLPRAVFPCDENGLYRNDSNCIWKDSGCGNDCLDEVATELNLW